MNILCTGGCGFVGSVLVPELIYYGHTVTVVDLQWFGDFLPKHPRLKVIKDDFRNLTNLIDEDAVIHLAGIANDPQGELNPKLAWEVNALGTMKLAETACKWGVQQFIYASSGSVYGVCNDLEVTENSETNPISDYNKTKMVAERCVLSYDKMRVQILRPGTVCGWSARMRLDVIVNRYAMQALEGGEITVMGGEQIRPHIHIKDMVRAYLHLLDNPKLTGIYNCGFENISVKDVAKLVSEKIACKQKIKQSNDPRSYRLTSRKLIETGFEPIHSVDEAIGDLAFRYACGDLKYDDRWINLNLTPKQSS